MSNPHCDDSSMKDESISQNPGIQATDPGLGVRGTTTQVPGPSTLQFQEIPIGGHFGYRDRRYRKLAISMASDEDRNGNIFRPETEVQPDPLA